MSVTGPHHHDAQSLQYFPGLGRHSISIQSADFDNVSLLVHHIFGNKAQKVQNNNTRIERGNSVRNRSLNSKEMGGAYSQSNYNLTIEDVNSLRDILIGKHFSGKIDGSLMGNKSLGWKPYSMKQSILSLNQHATPEKILFAQE